MTQAAERDYILGTHDEEIERLGLQHRVWRPRALAAWKAAGFTTRQTILDAGCGPGYASLDLAEIVGPTGRVVAVDRSRRFLQTLERRATDRGLANVDTFEADLQTDALPDVRLDGAWIRWVFAFVPDPRQLLRKIVAQLKPGARIVIHEYFDYSTWRLTPRSESFERFVATVMDSWRADGGEPDIGLELPHWLVDAGLRIERLEPIVEIVPRSSYTWQWPATFVRVGLARLVEIGRMSAADAYKIAGEFAERERDGRTLIITPGLLEIIASVAV